ERLLREGRDRYGAPFGKRMLNWNSDDNGFAEQRRGCKANRPRPDRQSEEGRIQAPAYEITQLLMDTQFVKVQFDIWICLAVSGNRSRQYARERGRADIPDLN